MKAATQMPNPDIAVNIIKSCYDVKLSDVSMSEVIECIGTWRAMTGSIKTDETQVTVEASFLKGNYKMLSLKDVNNAIQLFLNNKLDIDVPEFVSFSTMHISRVLNSYLRYKSKVVMALDEIAEKPLLELNEADKQSIHSRVEGIKSCILDCWEHSKEDFKERFFNQMVYDFLRKTGRLKINKQLIEEAKKYGEKKYLDDRKKIQDKEKEKKEFKDMSSVLDLTPAKLHEKSQAIRLYGIDYCLKDFFSKKDVKQIISSISEKDIETVDKK